ncbi:MAG: hypothetical protein ACJ72N_25105 [Labedaea sp.]
MRKLIVSAEAYGFGPAAKLHTLCTELARRGLESHFVGHDVALAFTAANPSAFGSIRPVRTMTELAAVPPDGVGAALSVMDPFLVLWASWHGVPCVYVDSLYWMWQWPPERAAHLRRTAAELRAGPDVAAALRRLSAVPMHDSQYIAHSLSTVSCAQRSPGTDSRASRLADHGRVTVVDAVVDLSHRSPADRTSWLATTSGLLNPLVPLELALSWLRSTARLIEQAARRSEGDEPVLLAGNPEVLDAAADLASDRVRLAPLDHTATLRAMNEAMACLTPPGLTTMLESAAYGTPVLLLPEQHYGHFRNYQELSRAGSLDAFPESLVHTRVSRTAESDVIEETRAIARQLRQHEAEHDHVWSRMVSALASGMTAARLDGQRLHAAQEAVILGFAGGYSGTAQVADVLEAVLGRGGTPLRPGDVADPLPTRG